MAFPSIQTKYIDVEFEKIDSLADLCEEGDVIGIVGRLKPKEMVFPDLTEIICISPHSEIGNLEFLRPYSFSRVFVVNEFQ